MVDIFEKITVIKISIIIMGAFVLFSCSPKVYPLGNISKTTTRNFYIKDLNNQYDKVVGTWYWKNENESFRMTVKKFEKYTDPIMSQRNIYRDLLFGKYTYKENGEIKSGIDTIVTFKDFHLALNYKTSTEYSFIIRDEYSGLSKSADFKILEDNKASLKFKMTEKTYFDGEKGVREFSIPDEMILVRQ